MAADEEAAKRRGPRNKLLDPVPLRLDIERSDDDQLKEIAGTRRRKAEVVREAITQYLRSHRNR